MKTTYTLTNKRFVLYSGRGMGGRILYICLTDNTNTRTRLPLMFFIAHYLIVRYIRA